MNSSLHTIDVFLPLCWNNHQLAQLRLDWERKSLNSWHLHRASDAGEMIVLVERSSSYSLNRYFYDEALSRFEAQQ